LTDAAGHPHARHLEEFWGTEAARLLAPLLHAAALAGEGIGQVVTWIDKQDQREPLAVLKSDGDPRAHVQLEGVFKQDAKNRGTIFMSAGNLLTAYRYPEVEATARPGFTATDLLDGGSGTLYITSTSRHQRMIMPVIVALVSSIIDAAIDKARDSGGALPFDFRALLDETANTAPLQDLPSHLSQLRSYNFHIATVWQSLAQIKERYGDSMHTILSASTTKAFMGPVTDQATLDYVAQLLGNVPVDVGGHSTLAPKAPSADLQQLGPDRTLVVADDLPPIIVCPTPWWELNRETPG
jgi:type IV secretory pathway TraG/TraD family ATPase VirD4